MLEIKPSDIASTIDQVCRARSHTTSKNFQRIADARSLGNDFVGDGLEQEQKKSNAPKLRAPLRGGTDGQNLDALKNN